MTQLRGLRLDVGHPFYVLGPGVVRRLAVTVYDPIQSAVAPLVLIGPAHFSISVFTKFPR
jgi:hypothetical protein